MPTGPTIAVLSPITGGFYFGGLLAGITREVTAAGGRVLLVQTLDAGLSGNEVLGAPDFGTPTGWDLADGFVSLAASTQRVYLERLLTVGKPVVLAGNRVDGLPVRSAMPDNAGGVQAAVDHLVRVHGHTRIAFAGNLAQTDMQERHTAFGEAMRAHGLEPDPALFFPAPDNAEAGGRVVAERMLTRGLPATAVVAATDRNALGIVEELREVGLSVPGDLAVVGFDDVERWSRTRPVLTTVNQQFDRVGALGARLLLAELRGEAVPGGRHTSPADLVPRTSCGCSRQAPAAAPATPPGREELERSLHAALLPDPDVPGSGTTLRALADLLAGAVEDVATGGGEVPETDLGRLGELLRTLRPSPESLHRVTTALGAFVSSAVGRLRPPGSEAPDPAVEEATRDRIIRCHNRLVSALWLPHTQDLLDVAVAQEKIIAEQYQVSMSLLDRDGTDPRSLAWMASTHVELGCLALWDGDAGSGRLRIVGVHDLRGGLGPALLGTGTTVTSFPPQQVLERADAAAGQVTYVIPVRARGSDWGLLAVVGHIDARSLDARATYNHWAALLTVAFEQERLLAALRTSEEHLRRRALHDAVTGLPNRTLFLERLTQVLDGDGTHPPREFAVLFLDLDGFKQVNDTRGHHAGDQLLVTIAERLLGTIRSGDTAARFGGDEFAVLLEAPVGDVLPVVERMQRAIAVPVDLDGRQAVVTASVGIAVRRRGAATAEQVLRDADAAMYRAKSTRRGSWVLDDGGARVPLNRRRS
ncbi:hypothetical protein NUM3379_35790 [Kineococcus sp. NUM-3379]